MRFGCAPVRLGKLQYKTPHFQLSRRAWHLACEHPTGIFRNAKQLAGPLNDPFNQHIGVPGLARAYATSSVLTCSARETDKNSCRDVYCTERKLPGVVASVLSGDEMQPARLARSFRVAILVCVAFWIDSAVSGRRSLLGKAVSIAFCRAISRSRNSHSRAALASSAGRGRSRMDRA